MGTSDLHGVLVRRRRRAYILSGDGVGHETLSNRAPNAVNTNKSGLATSMGFLSGDGVGRGPRGSLGCGFGVLPLLEGII
eukprot:15768763-Heterocapsa_arctica.AAC.1